VYKIKYLQNLFPQIKKIKVFKMAAANKMVEVLCQNGKRQKVKTKPAMTVLQILEEVCGQQQ